MKRVFSFINLVVEAALHGRDFSALMRERSIVDLRHGLRAVGYAKVPRISEFDRLTFNMPDGDYMTLAQVRQWLRGRGLELPKELPQRITRRERNVIFVPQSSQRGKSPKQLRRSIIAARLEKGRGSV